MISLAGCGHRLLNHMVYFDQNLHDYTFLYCLDTGMQNDDEVLLSISLTSHGQLLKMLILLSHIWYIFNRFCLLIHY